MDLHQKLLGGSYVIQTWPKQNSDQEPHLQNGLTM